MLTDCPFTYSWVGSGTLPAGPVPLMPNRLWSRAASSLWPHPDSSMACAIVTAAGTPYRRCAASAPGATAPMNACCARVSETGFRRGDGWCLRYAEPCSAGTASAASPGMAAVPGEIWSAAARARFAARAAFAAFAACACFASGAAEPDPCAGTSPGIAGSVAARAAGAVPAPGMAASSPPAAEAPLPPPEGWRDGRSAPPPDPPPDFPSGRSAAWCPPPPCGAWPSDAWPGEGWPGEGWPGEGWPCAPAAWAPSGSDPLLTNPDDARGGQRSRVFVRVDGEVGQRVPAHGVQDTTGVLGDHLDVPAEEHPVPRERPVSVP